VIRVVVVGGGIVGASCAYELEARGADVELVDAGDAPVGASARSDGYLLVSDKRPGDDMHMTLEALETWRDYAAKLPGDVEFEPVGPVLVAVGADAAEVLSERMHRLRELGIEAHERAPADADPGLGPNVTLAATVPADARVQPQLATAAILRAARDAGARLRRHAAVREVEAGAVELADGTELRADVVIVAAGAWTSGLLEGLAPWLPIEPRRGHLMVCERRAAGIVRRGALEAGYLATIESGSADLQGAAVVEPTRAGTVLLGSSRERVGFDQRTSAQALRLIAGAVTRVYPALAGCRVLRSWIGFRPWTPDGRPLLGAIEPGLVVAAGHEGTGICLGPWTGRLIARHLLDGVAIPERLAARRFVVG
jgi:glycine/D-amino acid oxidase-like deaminating enzyme